jgi:hypothetical protein
MVRYSLMLSGVVLALGGCSSSGDSDTGSAGGPDAGSPGWVDRSDGGTAAPPDGPSLCPAGVCNYQTNEGCGAAETCTPFPDGDNISPACLPAGSGKSGDACAEPKDCAPGYFCVTSTTPGTCRKLCCGGDWTGCPSDSEHCIARIGYQTPGDTGAMACYPVGTCDPLDPGSCGDDGHTCQIVDATGASACLAEASGEEGQPCPCRGGFLCDSELEICRKLCRADDSGLGPSCSAGQTCVHYNKHPDGVGECI